MSVLRVADVASAGQETFLTQPNKPNKSVPRLFGVASVTVLRLFYVAYLAVHSFSYVNDEASVFLFDASYMASLWSRRCGNPRMSAWTHMKNTLHYD